MNPGPGFMRIWHPLLCVADADTAHNAYYRQTLRTTTYGFVKKSIKITLESFAEDR